MALSWFENVFCFLLAGGREKGGEQEQASWGFSKKKVLEIRNVK